mmetsp:Transcript_699/g.1306  ORF Transcript_699/g.1306 Transcript_699/m.1306 type:complete len:837 (-) Transcript_699:91-2601(-)
MAPSNASANESANTTGAKTKDKAPAREWTPAMESDLQRILSVGEECISAAELKNLILSKGRGRDGDGDGPDIRLYDGFEPSGRMHIAQGVYKSINVNKCTAEGTNATFCFWVADWFALMNDKMGGDLDKIIVVGQYLIEVWKAAGMDLSHVEFRWASDEITGQAHVYWPLVLDVARRFNVTRIKKCCQIMGRLEGSLTAAQVLYPLMQCSDVFFLKADVCQLGVDQRKVNMLAREYCDASKKKFKPVILSHHMLYGLKKGQEKMSKSDPDSAIFMEDTKEDVERKISNAFCPTKEDAEREKLEQERESESESKSESESLTQLRDKEHDREDAGKESMHLTADDLKNPILDYIQHIIMSPTDATFTCANANNPAGQTYLQFDQVKQDFLDGLITPDQLKRALIDALNQLLQPVRDHFANDETAKGLFEKVQSFKRQSASAAAAENDGPPKVFRLDLVAQNVVPPYSHLVMAPLPIAAPTLQHTADLLAKLTSADPSAPKVLMLLDWTARVNNALDADVKAISAYFSVLLSSLRTLDRHLNGDGDASVMKNVTVVMQSEAILKDPSNYWISVINAGRHFSLDAVMGGMKDAEGVGKVIGRLMTVADVLAVNPKSIALDADQDAVLASDALPNRNEVTESVSNMSLDDSDQAASVEATLIRQFYQAKLSHPEHVRLFPTPQITHLSSSTSPNLSLQPPRESEAHKTEFDEYFVLDDPKVHGKSKMKKAFCEPGNIDFCPPIELLAYFANLDASAGNTKEVTISRSPENGGDVTYTSKSQLSIDFSSGALHPGDLKAAVSTVMVDVLTKMSEDIKKDGEAGKGAKALKAFEKKMAKQKKK